MPTNCVATLRAVVENLKTANILSERTKLNDISLYHTGVFVLSKYERSDILIRHEFQHRNIGKRFTGSDKPEAIQKNILGVHF